MAGQGNNRNRPSSGGGIAPSLPSSSSKSSGAKAAANRSKPSNPQAIPPAVANRMARRVAIATGIPTVLGMASFIVSYLLVSRGVLDIPPAATLVTSGGFFLLGLLGLSYGVLSASWEDAPGSLLGFEQVGVNISRLRSSFKRPPASS
ncbi:PAM68 family protein [Vulcanococcus sp.]|jgi:hypothetical protein|uniref:PAM68 family protein n=1 Tax=Vulcanococcus sp. TaxID=2856995 RepID=UPI003C101685